MTTPTSAVRTDSLEWVPLRAGVSMRPLHFERDGYALQLKVDPGTTIGLHRHTGEVHALNLSGSREIVTTGEIVGPGDYVHEPVGNVDSWRCHGDEPCVVLITQKGRVEYLDANGACVSYSDRDTALRRYLEHCSESGCAPDARVTGPSRAP